MADETAEVAVIPKKLELPASTADLTPVQRGWLQMCHNRNITVAALEKGELEIQAQLNGITNEKDLTVIQEKLKTAKHIFAEKQDIRKFFTGALKDKLIDKLMEYEKREEVLIAEAASHELTIRQIAAKAAADALAKKKEEEQYKAHIQNEYARLAAGYALKLEGRVRFYYNQALKEKKRNKILLDEYKTMILNELVQEKPDAAVKFQRAYVTPEEAMAIVNTIEKPDYPGILKRIQESIPSVFEMYDEDIKNAEAAIAASELREKEHEAEVQAQLTENAAMNNLVASADTFVSGPGVPTVKKKWEIVEENTSTWGLAVMSAFITNLNECQDKLLVKTWSKLSLGQMAAALSKVANDSNPVRQFPNLKMKEVIK